MSSIVQEPRRLRLDPASYEKFAAAGSASQWLALSILRHHVEPGSPSQTVSQPQR